jgi:hypothetical protein
VRTVVANLTLALENGRAGTELIARAAAAAYEILLGYSPGNSGEGYSWTS